MRLIRLNSMAIMAKKTKSSVADKTELPEIQDMNNNDKGTGRISKLSDDILRSIILLLTMREGAATCVLAIRWRYLWRTSSLYSLDFTDSNLLGLKLTRPLIDAKEENLERKRRRNRKFRISHLKRKGFIEILRTNFIGRVNQILKFHSVSSTVNGNFLISFPLGIESASHIDQWMMLAASQEVRDLELDFNWSYCNLDYNSDMYYTFPFQLFGASLNHLRLEFCNIYFVPSFKSLNSLVSLSLTTSYVTNDNLQAILSNCPIEFLSMRHCYFRTPTALKFVRPSATTLKRLDIYDCDYVYEIELQDVNLLSLELRFASYIVKLRPTEMKLSIKGAPHLKSLALNANPYGSINISVETQSNIPCLETLFLKPQVGKLPKLSAFNNLKRLVFSAKDDNSNLSEVLCFLEACPLLQHLHVDHRFSSEMDESSTIIATRPACHHNCLEEVEIYGFDGHPEQIEFAKYLLNNAMVLETMKVSTACKWYDSCGEWSYSEKAKPLRLPLEEVRDLLLKEKRASAELLLVDE